MHDPNFPMSIRRIGLYKFNGCKPSFDRCARGIECLHIRYNFLIIIGEMRKMYLQPLTSFHREYFCLFLPLLCYSVDAETRTGRLGWREELPFRSGGNRLFSGYEVLPCVWIAGASGVRATEGETMGRRFGAEQMSKRREGSVDILPFVGLLITAYFSQGQPACSVISAVFSAGRGFR